MPTQCQWAEPAGPCSALPEPTFGAWAGIHHPRAGLVPPRSCCDHWAHPELESCRDCQGWRCEEVGTVLSRRAGGDKIHTGSGAWSAAVLSPGPVQPGSVTTCPSATCQVWCQGWRLLRCHGPALCPPCNHRCCCPGLSSPQLKLLHSLPEADTGPAPFPQGVPQGCQPSVPGCFQPQVLAPQPCPR